MRTVLVRTALFGLVSAAMLAVAAATPAAAQPGGARNLGISGQMLVALEGGGLGFEVSESWEGRDLNGDGDMGDRVVHRVDGSGAVTNLGLAGSDLEALAGGGFAFRAEEPGEGRDLNGDGDMGDSVVHRVDGSGALTNLGLAGYGLEALTDGGFSFFAWEPSEGRDLNGDGDMKDGVVHRADGAGAVTNLGRAGEFGSVEALAGGGFVFVVAEHVDSEGSRNGQSEDLNGDGDMDDWVVHRVDGSGALTNLGLAGGSELEALAGGGFAFRAEELGEGRDLNGDGDVGAGDWVVHRVDGSGAVTNLGLAGGSELEALAGGGFTFWAYEPSEGRDLNGDGDMKDGVVHRVDGSGAVTNLGLAGYGSEALTDGGFSFWAYELGEGRDLNGDGDVGDVVVHRADGSGAVTNLGLAGHDELEALAGGGFAFRVTEVGEGRDLNGDGDAGNGGPGDLGDLVVHRVDGSGAVTNLGLAGGDVKALAGGGFAFGAYETSEGRDLNGDSDMGDWVVHWVDGSGAVANLGIAYKWSSITVLDGASLAFAVPESGEGRDLNGDGDTIDEVVHMTQGISVFNVARPLSVAEPGGPVTYEITVVNNSLMAAVTIDSLVDDVYGTLGGDADCQVGTALAPGASCSFSFVGAVSGVPGSRHTNVVTAQGTDAGAAAVSGSGTATVAITDVASSIAVTKDANLAAVVEPGGDVTFTVSVTNTSAVDAITIGWVSDNGYGALDGDADCQVGTVLPAGGSCAFEFTRVVSGSAGTSQIGTTLIRGTDDDGHILYGTDGTTVWITEPPGPVEVQSSGGDEIVVDLGGAGAIYSVVAVDPPVEVTPPPDASFPYGLVGFTVVGVDAGATVVVTVDFPEPLAEPFTYYKLQGGSYVDATSIAAHDGGRVTLTLVDNGPFDADLTPGVITDPGGPVSVVPSGSLVISKVFDPLSSGVSRTFPINWSCGNGTSGIVQVAGGGSATVDSIPAGTVCSVTESRPGGAPAGWYYANPTVAGSPATIAAGAPVAVTVTNTIVQSSLRDHVTMTLGGGMGTYDADLTGGDVAVTTDANGVLSVTGSGTVGTGTVSFDIRRFWVLPFHLGTVRVYDTGLNYSSFMLGKVTTLGPGVATGTTAFGGDFSKWPWRTGNATFTVTDGD